MVNVGRRREYGEVELDYVAVTQARNRLVKQGVVVCVSGRRGKHQGTYTGKVGESREIELEQWVNPEGKPKIAPEPTPTPLRDTLTAQLTEFRAMMDGVLAYLEYAIEMERSMKFWMEEAKNSGARWGAERRK
jgi:hypothetical protein